VIADPKYRQASSCESADAWSTGWTNHFDGVSLIAPRVIACESNNVQGTRAATAEAAAITDSHVVSRSVTEPTCWITGLKFITVVRELDKGFRAHRETCIEFDHARFGLSSCEGKTKDAFEGRPG
jgi:hypothetical protein